MKINMKDISPPKINQQNKNSFIQKKKYSQKRFDKQDMTQNNFFKRFKNGNDFQLTILSQEIQQISYLHLYQFYFGFFNHFQLPNRLLQYLMFFFYLYLVFLLPLVHNQIIKFNKARKSDNRQPKITRNSTNDLSARDRQLFQEFKLKNSKKYGNQQQQNLRFKFFQESLQQVENHNPRSSFKKKINKFADLQKNQWKKIFLTSTQLLIDPNEKPTTEIIRVQKYNYLKTRVLQQTTASQLDWRLNISFTSVKYQGMCSSCYVYVSVGAIQAGAAIFYNKHDQVLTFSEQQAIDCCNQTDSRCGGCNNGYISLVYKYYAQKGISSFDDYPFVYSNQAQTCNQNVAKVDYLNKTKPYIYAKSPTSAIYYLNQRPLSSMVDASQWRFYSEGIFDQCPVNFTLNHGVVLIGYQKGGNWILRNSWGQWWGQNGYVRITPLNSCGITEYLYMPIFLNS